MKKSYKLYLLIFFFGITFLKSYSATYYSRAVGPANWGTAATWSTVGFGGLASTTTPTNADDVIIWTGSTVTMNVAGAQCKSLTINGTASWTAALTTNVLAGGLTINNGGVISATAIGVLNVSGAFNVPAGATVVIPGITISITGATSVSGSLDFNNTSGTKTFSDITINNGGSWTSTGGEAFTISGSLTNNGTLTTPGAGVYTFSGTAKSFAGSSSITITTAAITGTYTNSNVVSLSVTGVLSGAGGLTQGANSTLFLGGSPSITTLIATVSPNLVTYNGALAQAVKGTAYNNLTINKPVGIAATPALAFTCAGNLTLTSGTLASGTLTHTVSGTTTITGGVLSTTNVASVYNLQSLIMIGGSINGTAGGTVNVATTFNVNSGSPTIGRCVLNVTGSTTVSGSLTFNNATGAKTFSDITINPGGVWAGTAAIATLFTINGSLTNNGTLTIPGTGTYTFSGASKLITGSSPITLGPVAITGTYTNIDAVSLTITGNLSGAGGLTQGLNSSLFLGGNATITSIIAIANPNLVTYNGAAAQIVNGTTYHHLTINKPATIIATIAAPLTCNGNLTLTLGILATNSSAVVANAKTHAVLGSTIITGGTLRATNSGDIINLQSVIMSGGSINGTATGTVNIATTLSIASGAPTIGRGNLNVLGLTSISGTLNFNNASGTKTLSDITINTGGTWTSSMNSAFTIQGSLTNNGTLTSPGTGVYTFSGTSKLITGSSAITIGSAKIAGTYTNSDAISLTVTGVLSGVGTLTQGSSSTLLLGLTPTITTLLASVNSNLVNYYRAGAENVKGTTYYNLTISGSGTKTLTAATVVGGSLLISAGTLDISGSLFALSVAGNFTNNGFFTQRTGTVTLNGASLQTLSGTAATTFCNLIVNNTSGGVTLGINTTISAMLTFTSGIITTGAFKVIITSALGTITGGGLGKFVNGFLQKNISTGAGVARIYEIGSGTDYLPINLTFASVTTLGNVTATVMNGEHPNVLTSCIDPAKSVNRYWRLTNSATIFTTYSATCTFIGVPTDADAGSAPTSYFMSNYNAGWTILTQGSALATTNQGTGISNASMGDLAIGEKYAASVSIASSATSICPGTSVTFTATPTNGGTTPVYQWKLNGANVGTNSSTYSNSALANGNIVTCVMTSNASCVTGSPATSNAITMIVNPSLPVSVSISATSTVICAGTSVTFTASNVNGGTTPIYQWKLNGVNVGSNASTYITSGLANADAVTCILTSSGSCAIGSPATSNSLTMTVNPNLPVSVSILASPSGAICSGTSVTFTATPTNGGITPSYQWKLNGANVGTNSNTYSNSALANGNIISCVLTSNATCTSGNPATSNSITQLVNVGGVWLGAVSTDWSNSLNWCGGVPTNATDVTIPSGTTFAPVLSANSNCRNINITSGVTLNLNNKQLTVYGTFSGTGLLKGSTTSSIVIAAGSGSGGTFYMDQTILGTTNVLAQLSLNRNSQSATIGNSLQIINAVTITSGTLITGNNLTLLSNAIGTARVDQLASGADITGSVTVQRYISSGTSGWLLIGAPVSGATLQQWTDNFTTGGFPGSTDPSVVGASILTYDETVLGVYDNGYVDPTNITNPIVADKGYWAYVMGAPLTIDVTGPLLKNTQTFPVTYTNDPAQPASEDGWNLISNPYASSIDWDDTANWTRVNVDDAVYGYSPTLDQYTSYVGGMGINGGSNLIASSQGFLIQTNGAAPILKITEGAKSTVDAAFLRSPQRHITDDYLRFNFSGNGFSDETVIRFNENATSGFDNGLDAVKFYSFNANVPGIASMLNTSSLSINALPLFTSGVSVPIKTTVGVSGTYTIKLDSVSNLPKNTCIVITDRLTGENYDLRNTSSFSFAIADTTTYPRFLLTIGVPISTSSVAPTCSYSADGLITASGVGSGPWDYIWMDPADSIVQVHNTLSTSDTLKNIFGGVYTVIVSGNSGSCNSIETSTVDVIEPNQITAISSIKNASCEGIADGSIEILAVNAGIEPFVFNWSNSNSTANNTNLLPNVYTLSISDSTGCVKSYNFTVGQDPIVAASFLISADTVYLTNNIPVTFTNSSLSATSYSWYFGDNSATDHNFSTSHLYLTAGIYNAMLVVSNGVCTDTIIHHIVVLDIQTTINESIPTLNVNVFQENNGVNLIFDMSEAANVMVEVYNALGQKVIEPINQNVFKGKINLNFSEITTGVYFIKIHSGDITITKKIVRMK